MPPCIIRMVSRNDRMFNCSSAQSRSPRKMLDFADSPLDRCIEEHMETSPREEEEELSSDCKALLSPRGPRGDLAGGAMRCVRGKRKFPGGTPGGLNRGLFSQLSPCRLLSMSPRASPTKRTKLSFGLNDSAGRFTISKMSAALNDRPPLRDIQQKEAASNDFVFTPPVGLPPRRVGVSPSVKLSFSPAVGSPSSSSSDGFADLLTLDEDTNLPPALPSTSSGCSLSLNSLLKGSILSSLKTQDGETQAKGGLFGLGEEKMELDESSGSSSRMVSTEDNDAMVRTKFPLRRALSYAGSRTPVPKGGNVKSAKNLFGSFDLDDGSPFLPPKSKVSKENVVPAESTSASSAIVWDSESCPEPCSKVKRILLHSVSEEPEITHEREEVSLPSPSDLCLLRERKHGGIPLQQFRSESTLISARTYRRSASDSHAIINRALKRSESRPNLIADCSRPYCLPVQLDGVKHPDLKNISPETLSKVLSGEYSHAISGYTIIDCRFPYEFEGGHIAGAVNIYTKDQILKEILPNEPCQNPTRQSTSACSGGDTPDSSPEEVGAGKSNRNILIFHCEFSSERAPTLLRFLRSRDRGLNEENYPALHYPELYLLEGGYKAFYESYPHHCNPQAYMTMLDPQHSADLRHFRAKSKTWAGVSEGNNHGVRRKPGCYKKVL